MHWYLMIGWICICGKDPNTRGKNGAVLVHRMCQEEDLRVRDNIYRSIYTSPHTLDTRHPDFCEINATMRSVLALSRRRNFVPS